MARKPQVEDIELADSAPRAASSTWANAAFVVESLVLLVAIVAAMAVFSSLFAKSLAVSRDAGMKSSAVQMAQSAAEEFSSDPAAVAAGKKVGRGVAMGDADEGDLHVNVSVRQQDSGKGKLYTAHVIITSGERDSASEVYALDASRYVKEAR